MRNADGTEAMILIELQKTWLTTETLRFRQYLDYDSNPIIDGVPDGFIESLTHDSIIIQIPYLKGRMRNRLERLLNVFDQDYCLKHDEHLMEINEENMSKDEHLLIDRLLKAAIVPNIRRDMEVEDEILSESN